MQYLVFFSNRSLILHQLVRHLVRTNRMGDDLDESTLRVFFSDSENDIRKSAVARRRDIRKHESAFAAAAELPAEGGKIDFLATGHANCKALEQYFR